MSSPPSEVAGVLDWSRPHPRAYGAATTLYERHPLTKQHAGSPIADCFALVARTNSAILTLADGVNWGEKACIAARSAVHGCVDYLNKAVFTSGNITNTTVSDIYFILKLMIVSFNHCATTKSFLEYEFSYYYCTRTHSLCMSPVMLLT